jgi:hypothetical protein
VDITSIIDDVVAVDPLNPQDADCFGGLWDGTGFVGGGKGTLLIELADRAVDEMTIAYGFLAKDTKGKDVYYSIRTTGVLVPMVLDGVPYSGDEMDWAAVQDAVNDGSANPEVIPNFFVQVAGGTPWTLTKSGSQKFACNGGGTFESGFGIGIKDPRDVKNNTLLCQ